MLRLPGLIDPHVHLREPGATHKEDFESGTRAALAGGFTIVLGMPNTSPPLTDQESLEASKQTAREKARMDYGLFLGGGEANAAQAAASADESCGLKLYLDQTYGPLRLQGLAPLAAHFHAWPARKPIAAHAEGRSLAAVLLFAALNERSVHICHVSRRAEILLIKAAKERGLPVTCEVTPHHLFLTADDAPHIRAGRSEVRPPLASPEDRAALWENMAVIDCFASDHAPHTLEEKDSEQPPPGFPGLETALALLYGAVRDGRLSQEDLLERMVEAPRRIFHLPGQEETWVDFDPQARWTVRGAELQSRCGWSPFEGVRLRGRVRGVTLRGKRVFEDGQALGPPGAGRDLFARR